MKEKIKLITSVKFHRVQCISGVAGLVLVGIALPRRRPGRRRRSVVRRSRPDSAEVGGQVHRGGAERELHEGPLPGLLAGADGHPADRRGVRQVNIFRCFFYPHGGCDFGSQKRVVRIFEFFAANQRYRVTRVKRSLY